MVKANFEYYRQVYQDNEDLFREDMAQNWLRKREAFRMISAKLGLRSLEAVSGRNAPAYEKQKHTFYALLSARASYIFVLPVSENLLSIIEYSPLPMRAGENLEEKTMNAQDIVLMGEKNNIVRISDRETGKLLIETIVVEMYCREEEGETALPDGEGPDLPQLRDGFKQQIILESENINRETFK